MAPAITPARRDKLIAQVEERQSYLKPHDEVVHDAYEILISIANFEAETGREYADELASCMPPDFLFDENIVQSEGRRFYRHIRDVLVSAGVTVKSSPTIPLPLIIAEVLYLSSDEDHPMEDMAEQQELMQQAKKLFNKRRFPRNPRHHMFSNRRDGYGLDTSEADCTELKNKDFTGLQEEDLVKMDTLHHPYARNVGSQEKHIEMLAAADALRKSRQERLEEAGEKPTQVERLDEVESEILCKPKPKVKGEKVDAPKAEIPGKEISVSRRKSGFVYTLSKKYEKESNTFLGTDGRSWSSHLERYVALAKAHDVIEEEILLELMQFTLGPGPKMTFEKYCDGVNPSWSGFKTLMLQKYSSEITHARTRDALQSISLLLELQEPDPGQRDTRNARAITRVANSILQLAKDLPADERSDKHLLQYLRSAIRGVEFTKNAQMVSLQTADSTFDSLSLALQTAAQVEDNFAKSSARNTSRTPEMAINHSSVENLEEDFNVFFIDRRLGNVPPRRSKKCGDNLRVNGSWKGKVLKCHDCESDRHLKFHRQCPHEVARRKKGHGILAGVQKQLRDGEKPVNILACIAIALDDATAEIERRDVNESQHSPGLADPNDVIDTHFNIDKDRALSSEEQRKEEALFSNNFAERFSHALNSKILENDGRKGLQSQSHFNATTLSYEDDEIQPMDIFFSDVTTQRPGYTSTAVSHNVNVTQKINTGQFGMQARTAEPSHSSVRHYSEVKSRPKFLGAVIDTGAARSCIGLSQANSYAALTGHVNEIRKSGSSFKFGDVCHPSRGTISISLPTPDGRGVRFNADVVDANVPLLLGLDTLDANDLLANTRDNILDHPLWTLPLERERGHVWVRWPTEVLYSRAELQKLHRHFKHPSPGKMHALLKKIDSSKLGPDTLQILKDIQEHCNPCGIIEKKQIRFQVGSAEQSDIVFNREILMDIMKIGDRHALHVVDSDTHFGAAKFLSRLDTKSVWNALLDCWVLVYAGQPDVFFMDQGSVFTSPEWKSLSESCGVSLKYSGVQHHNGISICERYHAPLRQIYRKIEIEFPTLEPDLMLKMAAKAMNDTMGPEGLVPTMLVFGIMPRCPPAGLHGTLPNQQSRTQVMQTARDEYYRIVNNLRIARALRSKVPEDADRVYKVGDQVRVYREEAKAYSAPLTILEISPNRRMLSIDMKNGMHQLYSSSQVKPYKGLDSEAAEFVEKVSDSYGPWRQDYVRPEKFTVHITEVIDTWDPRASGPKMQAAIKKEICGLISRGSFRVILREDLPDDANVLTSRFVLAIKDANTSEERYKARLVIGGHLDKDKASLVHAYPNLRQESARMLMALASIMGFNVWTQDITQAYLQSSTKLMREIYMKPTKEFELGPEHILQLMKPLYGLADSGDRWHYTLKEHHLKDLNMIPTDGDLSLYCQHIEERLSGLSGVYVDDTLQAGDAGFQEWTKITGQRFDATPREFGCGKFAGMEFEQTKDLSNIEVSMERYITNKLQLSSVPCSFTHFRSARAQLAWTTNCRPDVACAVAKCTQITEKTFRPDDDAQLVNRIVRHLKRHKLTIKFPKLDRKSLHIRAYADASHAGNMDLSSQLGIVVTLCDKNNQCSVIGYKSYKCRRITRSAIASECHALADAFDYAFMLKHDLEVLLQQPIPIQMLTDSKGLFDVIVKAGKTAERRLMIDIAACRQAYERHEIGDIAFTRSEYNLADCMTKIMHPAQLMNVMRTAHLEHPVEQWIIRNIS